jgi:hypothetical protein
MAKHMSEQQYSALTSKLEAIPDQYKKFKNFIRGLLHRAHYNHKLQNGLIQIIDDSSFAALLILEEYSDRESLSRFRMQLHLIKNSLVET